MYISLSLKKEEMIEVFLLDLCKDEFEEMGLETRFLQNKNISRSILKSTLRGMHYQTENPKLKECYKMSIWIHT